MAKKKITAAGDASPSVNPPAMSAVGASLAAKIKANGEAREIAATVIKCMPDTLERLRKLPPSAREVFLHEMADYLRFDWADMLNQSRAVMSASEAGRYGAVTLTSGPHAGKTRQEVPDHHWEAVEQESLELLRWRRAVAGSRRK